tara:strand:- start:1292 stop:2515 length:1224 start_codon:yes stop_codon:yes gene_type:complete
MFLQYPINLCFPTILGATVAFIVVTATGCSHGTSDAQAKLETLQIQAMDAFQLAFLPEANNDSLQRADGWSRTDAGRMVTKSFEPPSFLHNPKIIVNLTLKSAGDPWDKSGAIVLMPNDWDATVIGDTSSRPGISLNMATGFSPPLELLRFITPFGVGHFSHSEPSDEYRPVYIPEWEKEVSWQNDVSHLWNAMRDSITIGVYIDTWSPDGYELDLVIDFIQQPELIYPRPTTQVLSLANTTKYHSQQVPFDGFASEPLGLTFHLNKEAANAELHYIVTGHGGHSTGDEFVPCEHIIALDNDTVFQFTPWRDDCASFRRFNPSSGVWTERTFWRGDSIDERIASSDFSRSGWCPGSDVPALKINLGTIEAGIHQLTFDVPTAQAFSDTAMNFWNVASYLTWESAEGL